MSRSRSRDKRVPVVETVSPFNQSLLQENIRYLQETLHTPTIFQPLISSTLTAGGSFSGVTLMESALIKQLQNDHLTILTGDDKKIVEEALLIYDLEKMTPAEKKEYDSTGRIVNPREAIRKFPTFTKDGLYSILPPSIHIDYIGCNFGEIFSIAYLKKELAIHQEEIKKIKRGRRSQKIVKPPRPSAGTGKYFSSQITFNTFGEYPVKMFRNGSFQVPGIKSPSLADLHDPIAEVQRYLQKYFPAIAPREYRVDMRNCKTSLIEEKYSVDLQKLEELLRAEKYKPSLSTYRDFYLEGMDEDFAELVTEKAGNLHPLRMAELVFNPDRCFSLTFRITSPNRTNPHKTSHIKLLPKGKINLDGLNDRETADLLYLWLQEFYHVNRKDILVDTTHIYTPEELDLSDCSDCSIYASDLKNADLFVD